MIAMMNFRTTERTINESFERFLKKKNKRLATILRNLQRRRKDKKMFEKEKKRSRSNRNWFKIE